jgi:hypothetical protein
VQADVGKTVTVVDAGANGSRLTTTIASVTNSTTAVLAATASATLTNTWVTIGTRDRNIRIIGGLWDRGANTSDATGKGYSQNSIRLRRVDHVDIIDVEVASTAGQVRRQPRRLLGLPHQPRPRAHDLLRHRPHQRPRPAWADPRHLGRERGRRPRFGHRLRLQHLRDDGRHRRRRRRHPRRRRRGRLRRAARGDPDGRHRSGGARQPRRHRTNITYRSIKGLYATNSSVHVGGDFQDAATLGGTYQGILVDDVQADSRSVTTSTVFVPEGTFEDLTIRNVKAGISHDRPVQAGGSNASQSVTIKRLVADRIIWPGGTTPNGYVTVVGER